MWNAKLTKMILPIGLLIAGCGGGGGASTPASVADNAGATAPATTTPTTTTPTTTTPAANTPPSTTTPVTTNPGNTGSGREYVKPAACTDFYDSGFQLIEGKDETPPAKGFARPVKGDAYADPAYTSCVVRVTDHDAEGLPGFARNDYSRRQPFNADDSKVLIRSQQGKWHTYDTRTLEYDRLLSISGGEIEPHWHPTNPDLLYVMENGGGMTISAYNIMTDATKVVADFRDVAGIAGHPGMSSLTDIWPNAARAFTKGEGAPSADGRYWGLQVETADFKPLGMITYDMKTDTVTGVFDFARDGNGIGRPDHISMSPSGKYVVPSWNGTGVNCASADALGTAGK
ncbi:MAG TPA: hypothetical protein VF267_13065, partial [Gammaproteobacteria bacterium]